MVYDSNRPGQENQNSDDQENEQPNQDGDNNEILDTSGPVQSNKRRGRGRGRDDWQGEKLTFCENGNTVELLLYRTENRYYRIDFYLNGNSIKPVTLPGRSPASAYWDMLKTHINEIEKHVGSLED